MTDRDYGREQIRLFLAAIDRHLGSNARLIIIGGSAVALHHATSTTNDIDTYNDITATLEHAIERASEETGLRIPISRSSVAELPLNYEDRLERQFPEFEHLEVWVLEKHDIALSKVVRGFMHDDQQVKAMHRAVGLDFETLVCRFHDEMRYATGDTYRIRLQFLEMIETVFDELKRAAAERELKRRDSGQTP